jgi:ABC-type transport system substrate-binding protein
MWQLNLDPHTARGDQSFKACAAIYDTLYTYETGPEPVLKPSLAEGFPAVSEDGLTWTIKLRKDARFHNSTIFENRTRTLAASDVVASFKRLSAQEPDVGMYWLIGGIIKGLDEYGAGELGSGSAGTDGTPVEGISAIDEHTVQFKLTRPYGGLLTFLAHPASSILPTEAIAQWGGQLAIRAVGTGPYRVHAFSPGNLVILKRFDAYWGDKPAYERIVYAGERVSREQLDMFNDGRLAHLELSPGLLAQLQPAGKPGPLLANTGAKPQFIDNAGMFYLAFNMEDPIWGALDDDGRALRKAVTLALDRDKVGKDANFVKDFVRAAHEAIPPGYEFADLVAASTMGSHDAAAAKAALEGSKYKGGIDPDTKEPLVLELWFTRSDYDDALTNNMRAALQPLGISVNVQKVRGDFDTYRSVIRECDGQGFQSGWFLDSPDAQNFLQLLYGGNVRNELEYENHARYKSPDFDKAYKEFEALLPTPQNHQKRRELVEAMLKLLAKDRPICPLTVSRECHLHHPKVEWPTEPRATYNELRRLKPAKAEGEGK